MTTPLNTSGSFNVGDITDSNKAGSLAVAPLGTGILEVSNSLVLNSVGNITSTTSNFYTPGTMTLNSTSGVIGSSANNFLLNDNATISATTGKAGSVFINVDGSPTLENINAAGGVNITTATTYDITVAGNVTAASGAVTLLAYNIAAASSTASVSGQSLSLTSTQAITGAVGNAGQYLNVSVLSPSGTLALNTTDNAYLNVTSGTVNFASGSTASGVLALSNSTGSLTLGTGTLAAGPITINLSAKNNLTLNTSFEAYTPNTYELVAGGLLTLPGDTLGVSAANGGKLIVDAGTLAFTGSQLSLSTATTSAKGNGGNIVFDLSGKTNYTNYTIGTGGQLSFNALPSGTGSGGNIYISTGGALTINGGGINNTPGTNGSGGIIDIAAAGNLTVASGVNLSTAGNGTGSGANLTLSSGGNLAITGTLTAGAGGNKALGDVSLAANGKTDFVIGGANVTNGITGQIVGANNVQISNQSGISLTNALNINGTLEFDTTALSNTGTITGDTALVVNSGSGNLNISGAGTSAVWGTPSTVTLTAGGNLNAGNILVSGANTPLENAYNLTITAGGALTLGTNSIKIDNVNTAPGVINIQAASVITPTATSPLTLTAYGTSYDGDVSLTLTGTSPLTLGKGASQVQISVQNPLTPTNGGSVYVSDGGNLTVTSTGILTDSATAGINTNLTLLSGKNLQVQGFTQSLVGTGANLTFGSNSATPFTIGLTAAPVNGIELATGTLTGADIVVTNAGGGIGADSSSPFIVDAGALTLNAKGAVFAQDNALAVALGTSSGSSFSLNVYNGTLTQSGGMISTKALTLSASNFGGPVTTNAATVAGSSNLAGSTWNVIDTSTGVVTLGAVSAGSTNDGSVVFQTSGALVTSAAVNAANVVLIAAGNITVNNTVGLASGTTSLNANGGTTAISEGKNASINGANLSLQAGSGGIGGKAALTVDSTNLALLTSGAVNLSDTATASTTIAAIAQPISLFTLNSLSAGTVTLNSITSSGSILVNATTAAGGITSNNQLYSNGGSVTLNAGTAGVINLPGGTITAGGGNVTLTGSQINQVNSDSTTASGNITMTSTGGAGDTVAGTITAGGNFVFTSTGTANTITSPAFITAQNVTFGATQGSVDISSGNLTATAAKGAVMLTSADALTIGNSASSTITANSGGVILSGAGVEEDNGSTITALGSGITVTSSGVNALTVNGSMTASSPITLTNTGGTGSSVSIGGTLAGSSISITGGTGLNTAISSSGSLTAYNGGITLNTGSGVLDISAGSLTATNGNIAITTASTAASTVNADITANNVGNITLTNSGTSSLTISRSIETDQGAITLTASGTGSTFGLTNNGYLITGTGAITINLTGSGSGLSASGSTIIADYAPGSSPAKASGDLTFNLSGGNSSLSLSGGEVEANFGNLAINITGNTTGTALTVDTGASLTANTGSVLITSTGTGNAMVFGDANGSASLLANGGNITISATGSGSSIQTTHTAASSFTTYGGNINISVSGTGSFINLAGTSTGVITANDGSVTITAGSTSTGLALNSNIYAGNGNLNITNGGTGVTYVVGDLSTLNGNLNIVDSNAAGAIDFGKYSSTASAVAGISLINNGNVTIQNTNNANGVITIEAGNSVHASATATNLGNVTVADGTFTQSQLTAQTSAPTNVTYNFLPGGAIYFATSTPTGQPAFTAAGNILNANGRAVTLYVGGATGAINLNGGVVLTADPPAPSISASALQTSALTAPSINAALQATHSSNATQTDSAITDSANSSGTAQNNSGLNASTLNNAALNTFILNNSALNTTALNASGLNASGLYTSGLNTSGLNSSTLTAGGLGAVSASTLTSVSNIAPASSRVLYGGVSDQHKYSNLTGSRNLIVKDLQKGASLLAAEKDTILETSLGQVFVAKGSLALVVSEAGKLSVYNMDDTRSGAVVVMVGQEKITLAPGRHITLTSSNSAFESVNPIKTVAYRGVSTRKSGDNLTIHSAEFSLPSAMATIAPVKALVISTNQNERKVGEHLLKTAAIMQSWTAPAKNSPFELKTQPQTTAMR